jgi:hypothetical protein
MPDEGQLPELFCSENMIHIVSSFNWFENWGRQQQRGTFSLSFGQLTSKVWDVCSERCAVRIIMAYQPVVQKATMIGSVYQQHWWHYIAEGLLKNSRLTWSRNYSIGEARMNTLYFSLTQMKILQMALWTLLFLWEKGFVLYILLCQELPPSSEGTRLDRTQLMPSTLPGSSIGGWYLDFKDTLARGPLFLYNQDTLEGFGGWGHVQNFPSRGPSVVIFHLSLDSGIQQDSHFIQSSTQASAKVSISIGKLIGP